MHVTSTRNLGFKLGAEVYVILPNRHPLLVPDALKNLDTFQFALLHKEVTIIPETAAPVESKPEPKAPKKLVKEDV